MSLLNEKTKQNQPLRQPRHTTCSKMPLIKLLPLNEMKTPKKGKLHNEHFTEHRTFPEHASHTHRNGGKPSLIKVHDCSAIVFHAHKISKVSRIVQNPCFFLALHEFSVARSIMSVFSCYYNWKDQGRKGESMPLRNLFKVEPTYLQ